MKKMMMYVLIMLGIVCYNRPAYAYQVCGVDIEYYPGTYFTDDGKACKDHDKEHSGTHSFYDESACNCKCTYNGIALNSTQCMGYAKYMQIKLFGVNAEFYKVKNSYIPAGSLNVTNLKNLIQSVKLGAHLRTNKGSSPYQHSMIITDITDSGFSIIDCNRAGKCKVGVRTYTWSEYVKSTYGQRGIQFIELPKNYTLSSDTEKPSITNVKVTDISKSGYTVSCKVTDNDAVDRVQFPTWTEKNGQDDITNGWETASSCRGNKDGNTYTFKVKRSAHNSEYGTYITHIYAYDKSGNSTCVVVPNVNLDKPVSPKITKATSIESSITIEWSKVDDAIAYEVQRRAAGTDTSYEKVKTLPPSATSFEDVNLKLGTRYYYRVYAINTIGCSEKQSGYGVYTAPESPVIKNVSTVNTSKLSISWNEVTGASSYVVARRKSGTDEYKDVKTVSGTSLTDSGLVAGAGYWYKVYALNDNGKSVASESSYGMTKCAAPKVSTNGATSLTIQWSEVVGKTTYQYDLYRKGSADTAYKKIATTTETSYKDSGLECNAKYNYKLIVCAKGTTTQVTCSEEGAGTTAAVPAAPVISISNQDENVLGISWIGVQYATKYQIYRKVASESEYTLLGTTKSTSYLDKSVTSGQKYTYCVKSVNDAGSSVSSNEVSIYAVLPAPSEVTCTAKSATSIEVSWSAVKGADGYLIRRRKDGDEDYEVIVACTESDTTSFVDTGLKPSTKYYYKIRTWTGNQMSAVSNYGKATTLSSTTSTMEAPVVRLEPKDTNTINVSWNSVSGATKYEVYRRLAGEGYPDTPTYTTTNTSIVDENLIAGTRYWYRVYAVNSSQKSPKQSGVMSYTYPEQPKTSVETVSTTSLKATWTGVKGASYYILNIRKSGDETYETVTTTENTSYVVGGLEAGTTYYFRVYAIVSDRNAYVSKLSSEKPGGVGGTTKYDPATCTHSYGAWTVTKQASCTEAGSQYRICSKCDYKETETVSAIGHNYSDTWTILKDATCQEDGVKSLVCKTCGEQSSITIIKATGHQYEDGWVTSKEATCTTEGERYCVCTVCGNIDYESIPMAEHTYEVKKQKNSTVEEEGYIEYYCKDCDYSYTEVLEKLPKQEVTDISLSTNNLAMEDSGATDQLTYVISPEDATNQMVTWVSSDENVVTVDETGVITAVAVGQAAIVVQTEDGGYLDVCEIVVGTPEEYSLGEDEYDNEEADEDSTTQEPNGEISEEPTTQEPNGEISEEPTTQEPNGEISEEPTTQEPNGEISEEPTTQEPNGEISEEPTTQNPNGEVSENSTTKPDAIENPESKVDVADIKKDRGEEDLDNSSSGTTTNATENKISKNDEVLNGNLRYKVISQSSTKREVVCTGIESTKIKKVVIPTTITIEGTVYKVTSIENGAFKNNKKITSIVIGKNVTSIGKEAFKGCSKLKTITVKSTKIKKVGRNALKGIEKNATIKVPKKKKTAYKKLLKGKGQKKSVKIK